MTWNAYEVIFRLRSPLHIGYSKVGNLQRTRPYVTGRSLWGALTMRLTRDAAQGSGPATDSSKYQAFGAQVHECLAFTYFYPALQSGNNYQVVWPWDNETLFRHRFLGSYQSTALSYPQQSAAEGLLHEVEFISPYTVDTGQPVFLRGYVFERTGCKLDWHSAYERLQLGGERGYGWGKLELRQITPCVNGELFGGVAQFEQNSSDNVLISLPADKWLLAHTDPGQTNLVGELEPLVGREWRANSYVGQYVAFNGVYFTPGSIVKSPCKVAVKEFGIWHIISSS